MCISREEAPQRQAAGAAEEGRVVVLPVDPPEVHAVVAYGIAEYDIT